MIFVYIVVSQLIFLDCDSSDFIHIFHFSLSLFTFRSCLTKILINAYFYYYYYHLSIVIFWLCWFFLFFCQFNYLVTIFISTGRFDRVWCFIWTLGRLSTLKNLLLRLTSKGMRTGKWKQWINSSKLKRNGTKSIQNLFELRYLAYENSFEILPIVKLIPYVLLQLLFDVKNKLKIEIENCQYFCTKNFNREINWIFKTSNFPKFNLRNSCTVGEDKISNCPTISFVALSNTRKKDLLHYQRSSSSLFSL